MLYLFYDKRVGQRYTLLPKELDDIWSDVGAFMAKDKLCTFMGTAHEGVWLEGPSSMLAYGAQTDPSQFFIYRSDVLNPAPPGARLYFPQGRDAPYTVNEEMWESLPQRLATYLLAFWRHQGSQDLFLMDCFEKEMTAKWGKIKEDLSGTSRYEREVL